MKKIIAAAASLATILTVLLMWTTLGLPRFAFLSEVHANSIHIDKVEEVNLEDRLERMYYRLLTAVQQSNRNPRDSVALRAKISLESQIKQAEARLIQLRTPQSGTN